METEWKCHDSTELVRVQIFFLTPRGGSKRSRGILADSLNNEMSQWFPIPKSPRSRPLPSPSKGEWQYHFPSTIPIHHRPGTQEPASGPFIKPEARAAREWARGVAWLSGVTRYSSLAPARVSQATPLPQPPSPEGALGPQPFTPASVPPSGFRGVSGLLGRRAPKGSQSPGARLPRRAPSSPSCLSPRRPSPGLGRPSHGPSSRPRAARRPSLRLPRQVLAANQH